MISKLDRMKYCKWLCHPNWGRSGFYWSK